MTDDPGRIDALIEAGAADRSRARRLASARALGLSVAALVTWLLFVTSAGHWGRVGDHWASALTMVFGSFVAGSTDDLHTKD